MSAHSSIALALGALLLAGTAAAQDSPSDAPAVTPMGVAGAGTLPGSSASPASERGLKCRIPLADGDDGVYAPGATAATTPAGAAGAPLEEGSGIGEHLALNLQPTQLRSPNAAGRRLGHGNIVLSVPLNDSLDIRTGVRLDYDSTPGQEPFEAEATPTIGVGFEF